MSIIIRFKFPELWNSEYPLVVSRIIEIVEAHEPNSIHLKESFERLAAFRPKLAKMVAYEYFKQESALLKELNLKRDTFFNIIYMVSKEFQRTPISEISNYALHITKVIKKHGQDTVLANYTAKTKRLYDLIADVKTQPETMKSLEVFFLMPLFVQMEEVNREFDRLFMQRSQRQAESKKINIHATRLECDKTITLLWNAIEFCCNNYGEQNYLSLIAAINNLNAYYKQQLASRATRRKANQKVTDEKPIKPIE